MSDKVLKFLRVIGAQFAKRHASPADEKLWLDSMIHGLRDYDASVLERAAQKIIMSKTDPGFPYLAECRKVCEEIARFDDAQRKPKLDAKPTPRDYDGHADWQHRLADDLIMCPLGRRAAEEGWILSLHDFCRNNQRLPTNDYEVRKCIDGARGFDQAYESLLRNGGALASQLISLGDKMLARRESYRARVTGEG